MLGLMFAMAAYWLLIETLEGGSRGHTVLLGLAVFLGLLNHLYFALFAAPLVLLIFWYRMEAHRVRAFIALCAGGALAVPVMVTMILMQDAYPGHDKPLKVVPAMGYSALTLSGGYAVGASKEELHGSDAMNPDPDYSAVYVTLTTDGPHEGHGLTFTIGRGTEICTAAIRALTPLVIGLTLGSIRSDMRGFWRRVTGDSQLRWIGPEKGAIHMATGAVVNAVWDLYAKAAGKPLWKLLVDMSCQELVSCIDFRYIQDALNETEAIELLERIKEGRVDREAKMLHEGYPAYLTSAGWIGYSDQKVRRLCQEGLEQGWRRFKIKVGGDIEEDIRRAEIVRQEIGW